MCHRKPRVPHVDLGAFFVSVEQAPRLHLRAKAVMGAPDPSSPGVVARAPYETRACGVHAGTPLRRAHLLSPNATFTNGSLPRYPDALARFAAILSDFTPQLEPLGMDEPHLDLTGFESIYGAIFQTALRIKRRGSSACSIPPPSARTA